MKVFPKVPRLSFLIVFAAIVSGRAKAQQQEANRAGEGRYKQRCAACHEGAAPRAPNRARLQQMSPENVRLALLGGSMAVEGLGLSTAQIADLAEFLTGRQLVKEQIPAAAFCAADRERDRKSTRLNSSHLGISYAVFCLKKKTACPHLARTARHCPATRAVPVRRSARLARHQRAGAGHAAAHLGSACPGAAHGPRCGALR